MIGFTPLETRVLDLIGLSSGQLVEPLRALVQRAQVTKRDNTGHGFYTRMSIEEPVEPPSGPNALSQDPTSACELIKTPCGWERYSGSTTVFPRALRPINIARRPAETSTSKNTTCTP